MTQEHPATSAARPTEPCERACTEIINLMTDYRAQPNQAISAGGPIHADGYRYINIFVKFSQQAADEPPTNLGVIFSLDASGTMGARCYVNLEENEPSPQSLNFIEVSGAGSWHGGPHDISVYVARFPVMGPWVQVFIDNFIPLERTVSAAAYLVS